MNRLREAHRDEGQGAGVNGVAPCPTSPAPKRDGDGSQDLDRPEHVKRLVEEVRRIGLCGNCSVYESCLQPSRGKKVWHCDEYHPVNP